MNFTQFLSWISAVQEWRHWWYLFVCMYDTKLWFTLIGVWSWYNVNICCPKTAKKNIKCIFIRILICICCWMWCVTIIGVSSWYTVNICCTKTASKAYIVSSILHTHLNSCICCWKWCVTIMGVSRRYHVNIKGVSKGLNGWQALCLRTFGLSYDTDIKCIIIVIITIIISRTCLLFNSK